MVRKIISLLLLMAIFAGCSQSDDEKPANGTEGEIRYVGVSGRLSPVVYFYVAIESGSANDPDGKEGLAWFTANFLRRGTESYSRQEIDNRLEYLGGKLNIRVDREVIEISGQTLLENLDEYYAIFSDIILNPAFPRKEAENLRSDQKQALKDIIRDDAELSQAALLFYLYRNHPYSHPVEGTFSSISTISADNARDFYQSHFLKGNIICGLAGNYSDDFAQSFQKDMAALPAGTVEREHPQIAKPAKRKVILVHKEGRDQAQIRMGRIVSYNRGDSVWYPLMVANTYLGQHRESFGRLFQTIRAERGMSYGAYSYHEHFQQAGWSKNPMPLIPFQSQYFSIWTYPKKDNVEFAIKMAIYELDKLIWEGIDAERLEKIKSFQINYFPFLIETPFQRLAMALEEICYDVPNFAENYGDNVASVNQADLISAVSRHWSSDDLTIVVIADNTEELKAELLTLETDLNLPKGATGEGLEDVNNLVKNLDLALKPEDIVIVDAEELFH